MKRFHFSVMAVCFAVVILMSSSFTPSETQAPYYKLQKTLDGSCANLAGTELEFFFKDRYQPNQEEIDFSITDWHGQILFSSENNLSILSKEGYDLYSLDLTGLSPGTYILEVQDVKGNPFFLRFKISA